MSITSVKRACVAGFAFLALVLLIGCQGPPGPAGPPGAPGSGGGPPYVWVCTPAHWPNMGSNSRADLYVFNGSTSTANVAVHILNKDGVNLFGQVIPGTAPPANYPGQTGAATVPVAPANTLIVTWQTPQSFTNPPGLDQTKVQTTVRVVSDQPIAAGTNFEGNFSPVPCSLLPK